MVTYSLEGHSKIVRIWAEIWMKEGTETAKTSQTARKVSTKALRWGMLMLLERVRLRTDEMSVETMSEKTGAGSCLSTRNTYNRSTGKAR